MTYTLEPLPRTATPSDYTRIQFDPAQVPAKRIVGLLACQRDPLLRSLRTHLISAKPANIAAPPPPKGKGANPASGGKKQKAKGGAGTGPGAGGDENGTTEAEADRGKLWEIQLNDTVIFPEGGGQPADTGKIHICDANDGAEGKQTTFLIEGCLRRKLDSVHLVRVPPGQEAVLEGIADGDAREAEVEVDWKRRMDHMTIHTAQHLLSAVLDVKPYVLPTLSWSMHPHPSLEAPYVELSRSLTPAEAEDVEKRCQALIDEGKKIWVDVSVQRDATSGSAEGDDKAISADDERESRGLPKDYAGGVIRHINIEDTDRNACCGTQCPNLTYISAIHVIPPTTSSPNATKLYFVAGPRAIRYLTSSSRTLTAAAQVVGTGRQDLVERLEKFDLARKEGADSVRFLRGELSKVLVEKAVSEGTAAGAKGVVMLVREEKATHDFEFLGTVAGGYLQSYTDASTASKIPGETEHGEKPIVIMISAVPGSPTLLLIQSMDQDLAKDVNEKVKKVLEGRVKGGGAKGRYMSKVDGKWGKGENGLIKGIVVEVRAGRG